MKTPMNKMHKEENVPRDIASAIGVPLKEPS